jgi:hypothetical protein
VVVSSFIDETHIGDRHKISHNYLENVQALEASQASVLSGYVAEI